MRKLTALFALSLALSMQAQQHVMTVDVSKPTAKIQPEMYGIFFEDINFGADGGLYAELVKNRSFEFPQPFVGWVPFGNVTVQDADPCFDRNPHYVRVVNDGRLLRAGLDNEGYRGIGVKQGEEYRFSVYARTPDAKPMKLSIELVNSNAQNLLKKEIKRMFAGNNDLQVYKEFFEWIGKPELFKLRKNRILEYTDLAPLAYLHLALDGNITQYCVKHLLIDEMQDYSPIQYKVIQKLYPCRKTILGDASQSVNPYGSSTAGMIRKAFTMGEVMKLCKSYRSTFEITDFAQKIQTNNELEPIMRHGEFPSVLQFENTEKESSGIIALISSFKKSGYKSLGIVCKTEAQAKELAESLQTYTAEVYFLSNQSSAFVKGIIVTSSHMAKGLEFDEVIIPYVNDKNYNSAIDKSMLYVAVTRAMHKLTLTYNGKLSEFVPAFKL